MGRIKQEMNVGSDDEWKAIQPLIQKVMAVSADLNRGRAAGMGGFVTGQSADSTVARAIRDLRAALKNPSTPDDQIAGLLKNLRDAWDKARADFAAARQELESVLTVRQEGVLLFDGLLQ